MFDVFNMLYPKSFKSVKRNKIFTKWNIKK